MGSPDSDRREVSVDPEQQRLYVDPEAPSIEQQYLTARAGTNLREEVTTPKGRAMTWKAATEAFTDYIWRQWKAADTWETEKGISPTSHRFTEDASKDRYARTLGAERAAFELWGDDLTTVHVVRRARPFGKSKQPQPPVDHLHDLLSGNSNVYRTYERHIGENHGLTYARLSVIEPHRNGYGHVHDALFVEVPRMSSVMSTYSLPSILTLVPFRKPNLAITVLTPSTFDRHPIENDCLVTMLMSHPLPRYPVK